jgi:hypothetical protein
MEIFPLTLKIHLQCIVVLSRYDTTAKQEVAAHLKYVLTREAMYYV